MGSELVGIEYMPLFEYNPQTSYKVLSADFVQIENLTDDSSPSTGIVHLAPAYGEDDFQTCIAESIVSKTGDSW